MTHERIRRGWQYIGAEREMRKLTEGMTETEVIEYAKEQTKKWIPSSYRGMVAKDIVERADEGGPLYEYLTLDEWHIAFKRVLEEGTQLVKDRLNRLSTPRTILALAYAKTRQINYLVALEYYDKIEMEA